ncbi:equilibrative nucleoside transporter 2-like isoform X2 [Tubulanus polymorphus]|uniref:equilibrative nucleoside transporter 2-like isoform X2 n=1 Tax=Tubulanus polymorphus TaxID=672921 RepID=UPI003DA231CF
MVRKRQYFIDYKLYPAGDVDYRRNFLTYAGISSQIPNTCLNIFNLFYQGNGKTKPSIRIVVSMLVLSGLFVLTIALAVIDTSQAPELFFGVTLLLIVFMNMCTGVWSNCFFGIAAQFPAIYLNSCITGMNVCGVIVSVLSMTSKTGSDPRSSAIIYFVVALLILITALDLFIALPLTRYYRVNYAEDKQQLAESQLVEGLPYMKTFKQMWLALFDVWFHRFISMTIYPAILVDIKRMDPDFFIPDEYFTDVIAYMIPNVLAVTTNMLSYSRFAQPPPKTIILFQMARFMFIPFYLLCNFRPETRSIPVVLNDYWFLIGAVVFGLLNGHMSGITFMYAKRAAGSDPRMQKVAGMMTGIAHSTGYLTGHPFTLVVAYLVENIGR